MRVVEEHGKREGLPEGAVPLPLVFQVFSCLVNVCGQGAGLLLLGSRATALFRPLMPAIQGSPKIGLGNSLKVIT